MFLLDFSFKNMRLTVKLPLEQELGLLVSFFRLCMVKMKLKLNLYIGIHFKQILFNDKQFILIEQDTIKIAHIVFL